MTRIKRILFAVLSLLLLSFLMLGAHSGSRKLVRITSAEAAALIAYSDCLADDSNAGEFGTLTIEGVKAPFDYDSSCYYLPQSMKTDGLDGLVSWSDRAKDVYLVANELNKSSVIASGEKLTLLIIGKDGYFYRNLILTGLPLVTLDTDDASNRLYGDDRGRGAIVRIYDPNGSSNGGYSVFSSGVRYQTRGGSTQLYEKNQYKLSFLTNGGKPRSAAVLGLEESSAILMSAQEYEESRFRDALCKSLWNELCTLSPSRLDFFTPNSQFAEMLINGSYFGVYSFFEKTPLEMNDFESSDILAKIRWISMADRDAYLSQYGEGAIYENLYFPLIQGDASFLPTIKNYVTDAEERQFNSEDADTVFCEANAVDYALYINAVSGIDNIHGNYFLYGTGGRTRSPLARIPWDLDRTFGKPFGEDVQFDPGLSEVTLVTPELNTLILDCNAWELICTRWLELRKNVFGSKYINARIKNFAQILESSGAYAREGNRWENGPDPKLYQTLISYSDRHLAFLDEIFSEPNPSRFLSLAFTN